jgi:mannosyltransferase
MTRFWRWMPVGVFGVALVLGIVRLGAADLWYDELFTRDTATLSWSGIWEAARDTEAPHLVYYALLKPWLAVAGSSEWALRLPSVVFGALAAGVTAALGRRLFGELAGLVGGLALAGSSFFVSWSQQARSYTLAVLLATAATYAFVRAYEERSTVWWTAWAVALVAAGWVNIFAFSVIAAHLAAVLLMRPRPAGRAPMVAACVAVAVFVPQLVLVASGDNGQLDWIPTPTPYRVAVGM